jgi:hypothetical protein
LTHQSCVLETAVNLNIHSFFVDCALIGTMRADDPDEKSFRELRCGGVGPSGFSRVPFDCALHAGWFTCQDLEVGGGQAIHAG